MKKNALFFLAAIVLSTSFIQCKKNDSKAATYYGDETKVGDGTIRTFVTSLNDLSQIVPGPDSVAVAPQYVPTNYITGVMAVPNMGVHWVDTTSSEFQGKKFTATFIYGFYHGKMLFVEPMITKEFLETHPNVTMDVKQPSAFQKPGYYPTKWSIHYDANKKEYTVALEGLEKH